MPSPPPVSRNMATHHYQQTYDTEQARHALEHVHKRSVGLEHAQCGLSLVDDDRNARVFALPPSSIPPNATAESPLFRLPEAVRLRVYALAMTYAEAVPVQKHSSPHVPLTGEGRHIVVRHWRFVPPLLRTCRAVHNEAAPLFYAANEFSCTIRDGDLSEVLDWLHETAPLYLSLVPKLILSIEPTSIIDLLGLAEATSAPRSPLNQQCNQMIRTMSEAGMETSAIEISTPELKHLKDDAIVINFDNDDAEGIRSRYVEASLAAVEKAKQVEEERQDLVRRFEYHMSMGMGVPGMRLPGAGDGRGEGRRFR